MGTRVVVDAGLDGAVELEANVSVGDELEVAGVGSATVDLMGDVVDVAAVARVSAATSGRGSVTSARTKATACVDIHTDSRVATIHAATPKRFMTARSHGMSATTLNGG